MMNRQIFKPISITMEVVEETGATLLECLLTARCKARDYGATIVFTYNGKTFAVSSNTDIYKYLEIYTRLQKSQVA